MHPVYKAFSDNSQLKRHLKTHTGMKPYQCNHCDKAYTQSGDLKIHMRTHTGEKPYHCNQCDKTFTHMSVLTKHLRIHNGEKPYQSSQCVKAFTSSINLTLHLRKHWGETIPIHYDKALLAKSSLNKLAFGQTRFPAAADPIEHISEENFLLQIFAKMETFF